MTYSVDNNATVSTGRVPGKFIFSTVSQDGNYSTLSWDSSGRLGVGVFDARDALDVRGGGFFSGTVTANGFIGSIFADDSTLIVDRTTGDVTGSTVTSNGFVMFGSYDLTGRSGLTAANGMVIYNTTANRFQGFQNGAWINLDDGTAAP
jgi:hypothetical protein